MVRNNKDYTKISSLDYSSNPKIDTLWIKYQIIDDTIDQSGVKFVLREKMSNLEEEYLTLTVNKEDIRKYEINLLPIPIEHISSDDLIVSCYYKDIKKDN